MLTDPCPGRGVSFAVRRVSALRTVSLWRKYHGVGRYDPAGDPFAVGIKTDAFGRRWAVLFPPDCGRNEFCGSYLIFYGQPLFFIGTADPRYPADRLGKCAGHGEIDALRVLRAVVLL